MNRNKYIVNRSQIKYRGEYFGGLLFDKQGYGYSALNKLAKEILDCFQIPATVMDVCSRIKNKYNLTDFQVTNEIKSAIDNYIQAGYLINKSEISTKTILERNSIEHAFLSAPIEVTLNPDRDCNQNCIFCYEKTENKADNTGKRLLTIDEYEKMVMSSGWCNVFTYSILGGEPFLHFDRTMNLISMLSKHGFNVTTTTNGCACTGREEEVCKCLGKFDSFEIAVSLESYIPETHDFIVGRKGSFNQAIVFLKEAVEHIRNVSVNVVINKLNCEDVLELAKYVRNLGVKVITCTNLLPCVSTCNTDYSKLALDQDAFLNLTYRLYELSTDYFRVNVRTGVKKQDNSLVNINDVTKYALGCAAGNRSIEIDINGDVYPCCTFVGNHKMILGNVLQNSFTEIWHHPILEIFRDNIMNCVAIDQQENRYDKKS